MIEPTSTDLETLAQTALRNSPIHALRVLRVQCEGELLTISGRVGSFYHKQLAQEAVRAVVEEAELHNVVDVD